MIGNAPEPNGLAGRGALTKWIGLETGPSGSPAPPGPPYPSGQSASHAGPPPDGAPVRIPAWFLLCAPFLPEKPPCLQIGLARRICHVDSPFSFPLHPPEPSYEFFFFGGAPSAQRSPGTLWGCCCAWVRGLSPAFYRFDRPRPNSRPGPPPVVFSPPPAGAVGEKKFSAPSRHLILINGAEPANRRAQICLCVPRAPHLLGLRQFVVRALREFRAPWPWHSRGRPQRPMDPAARPLRSNLPPESRSRPLAPSALPSASYLFCLIFTGPKGRPANLGPARPP